jgi:hypothetical protein
MCLLILRVEQGVIAQMQGDQDLGWHQSRADQSTTYYTQDKQQYTPPRDFSTQWFF